LAALVEEHFCVFSRKEIYLFTQSRLPRPEAMKVSLFEVVLGRSHDREGGIVGDGHRLQQPHNSFEVFFSPVLSSPQARVSHTPVISTHAWANKSARFELSS
jgi:hypothetical protein